LSALSIDFVAQISALMQRLQKSAAELDIKSLSDLQQFPWIARINVWLEAHAGISAEQVQSWLVTGTREVLQRAASMGGGFFLGALGSLLGFGIMLFLLFFFLRDGDAMVVRARRLIPLDEERKGRLFSQLGGVTRAIVIGTSVTALFQGFLVGIGYLIAGLPSPVVFGVLAALLAMLPVGGTALVWGPAAIWLFVDGRWGFCSPAWITCCARRSSRAARGFRRWRCSSAFWAEFRRSAPSASSRARWCSPWYWP
jgi:predicted PurR-regulated permease PerM